MLQKMLFYSWTPNTCNDISKVYKDATTLAIWRTKKIIRIGPFVCHIFIFVKVKTMKAVHTISFPSHKYEQL